MKTWRMIVDIAACEGCNNCMLACKDEHVGNAWPGYSKPQPLHEHRWIDIAYTERGQFPLIDVAYMPVLCMHCEDAPCVKVSNGAIRRRTDGIILIDPDKAEGRRDLVGSCPYHQIRWNEAEQVPQKCTLCAHLLDDGWKQPRCVQACPTGALQLEQLDEAEMKRREHSEVLEPLHPEYMTGPRVYYRNMYRYASCFIAGSVVVAKNGTQESLAGTVVYFFRNGQDAGSAITDAYGDFKLDNLPSNADYEVRIAIDGFETKVLSIRGMEESTSLGIVVFE